MIERQGGSLQVDPPSSGQGMHYTHFVQARGAGELLTMAALAGREPAPQLSGPVP